MYTTHMDFDSVLRYTLRKWQTRENGMGIHMVSWKIDVGQLSFSAPDRSTHMNSHSVCKVESSSIVFLHETIVFVRSEAG